MPFLHTITQATLDGATVFFGDACLCDSCGESFISSVPINPNKTITYCKDCTKLVRAQQRTARLARKE